MKKILFLLSASLLFISCKKDKYTISGTITGIENGKTIILETQNESGMGLIAIDTVKVEDGKFVIEGKALEPSFHTLQVEGLQGKVPFILENGDITVVIDKDSLQKSKVTGSYNNEEYNKFNDELKVIQKKLVDFQKNNMTAMNEAQQKKDTVVINKLMQEFSKIQTEVGETSKTKYIGYAETHPKALISALIIQGMIGDPSADIKKAEAIYNSFEDELKNTKPGKAIKTKLAEIKNPAAAAQMPAPSAEPAKWSTDFSAPNPEGKVIALKDCLGKVTIVDFWASWCGPCRQENPNVVALYNELHSKGLNIIGVSLDKDKAKWKEAIAQDKLVWTQVSNLKFWDEPIARQYKVESIPATFILDANGKVVAQDLRGEALKAKVLSLLAK